MTSAAKYATVLVLVVNCAAESNDQVGPPVAAGAGGQAGGASQAEGGAGAVSQQGGMAGFAGAAAGVVGIAGVAGIAGMGSQPAADGGRTCEDIRSDFLAVLNSEQARDCILPGDCKLMPGLCAAGGAADSEYNHPVSQATAAEIYSLTVEWQAGACFGDAGGCFTMGTLPITCTAGLCQYVPQPDAGDDGG